MRFVQITDSHINPDGTAAFGRIDVEAALERCVATLNALDEAPEFVLHTGDLVDRRTPAEYARFRELMAGLRYPFYAIPGNHDGREAMRAGFADCPWMPKDGDYLHFTIEDHAVRVIALDCIIPRAGHGELDEVRLAWLEARLAEKPGRPTVVALHHPPFATGNPEIDRGGFGNVDRFAAILRRHENIERVICGHVHRDMFQRFGGTLASAAPSLAYAFALDTRPGAPLSFAFDLVGFHRHDWDGTRLLTHTVPLGDFDPPMPFLKDGKMLR